MMFSRYICRINRNFSCNVSKTVTSLPVFRHDFTKHEENTILDTINKCDVNDLTKLNLSKARALKVVLWRSKHGPFKQVEQMLELDGFGEKILQKFCKSIIENKGNETKIASPVEEISRKISQYCTPRLSEASRSKIKSCLGVHVHAGSISWAKLTLNENSPMTLDTWNDHKFDERKMHLADLVSVTKEICLKMPIADTYVLEAPIVAQPTLPGKNVVQLNVNVQKSQLIGMTALGLLYKPQENIKSSTIDGQQVFFVKNFLPARLFRTKVGSERISTENTILDILRYHYNLEDGVDGGALSDHINASHDVRHVFEKAESYQRDLMGQAFLTALTFVRLCIQKCPKSVKKLETRSN